MKLVIVHHHLRPGGIRRVIELATPHILRAFRGRITDIVIASGEAPDDFWRDIFLRAVRPANVQLFVEPVFGYFSEQKISPRKMQRRISAAFQCLLFGATPTNCIVWAHNLGLARNLLLTDELVRECDARNLKLLAHSHDWWFDNRWQRWPELRRAGFHTLQATATAVFGSEKTRHISINCSDWSVLKKHFHAHATWIPNPAERAPAPPATRVRAARRWLDRQLGESAPVWILPCRLLRRKNVAEALLLKNWLRPEAWLVTTGGVSSADEKPYGAKLVNAARENNWRLRLGVLGGDESLKPSVAELLATSEAVLLTSIQEGFGLPYIEAAAAERPLIARNLPNVEPDLRRFGFRFPQIYDEILIHPSLFNWRAEYECQKKLFTRWLRDLPPGCRRFAEKPAMLATAGRRQPVPFSRLTLDAQIEVLEQPAEQSWKLCAPLNPFLPEWRRRAVGRKLRVSHWPSGADRWLGRDAYGKKFRQAAGANRTQPPSPLAPITAQKDFIRIKLASEFLYPLLWSREL